MGKGIATHFKTKYGGVQELTEQGKKPGDVAVLKRGQRYVYYLVTKERYWQKPTYISLRSSLQAMKRHSILHNVAAIAMPRIGCGLDGLVWDRVREILTDVFKDTDIKISVYTIWEFIHNILGTWSNCLSLHMHLKAVYFTIMSEFILRQFDVCMLASQFYNPQIESEKKEYFIISFRI